MTEVQAEPPRTAEKLRRVHELLGQVVAGLEGRPFSWGDGERRARIPKLRAAGVELVTRTEATTAGHVLKYGARAVGRVYFGAPVSRTCEVWILHVQTRPQRVEAAR